MENAQFCHPLLLRTWNNKLYMKFFVHCSVKENYLYSELYALPRQFLFWAGFVFVLVLGVVWWWCPNSKLEMTDDMLAGYYGTPPTTTFPSLPIVKAEKHVNNAVICQWIIIENMGLSFLDFILRTSVMYLCCYYYNMTDNLNLTFYDIIPKQAMYIM